ncbi:IclR family transcriptional regulator [Pararobbsia silviterrae]|uniref:IclR family transcriptional regulator n=1 Tax=Pararobbsia silviterrae TaxID=1792498 RepID=A0A494Y1I4_9BURK|nr:IclR family transcriptional regulator [Pararobbsia silviterrae]RKP53725.1 IclR family transcriptional regulator [Pararobbsia silviterrae]
MSQSIERAIEVLMLLGGGAQTPAEVARRLDVHRSTALRIMDVLFEQRLLRKLPDGRYGIGPGILSLAHRAQDQFDLAQLAHPKLLKLNALRDQTVHLAELQHDEIFYVDKIEPRRSIRLTSRIGQAVCLHTASVAKSILAFLPSKARDAMLDGYVFDKHTPTTLSSRRALERELQLVRERGWATDDGEREDYVASIGAPIRDVDGNVVAAVSVIELKAIHDLKSMESLMLDALLETADAISRELGWTGAPVIR